MRFLGIDIGGANLKYSCVFLPEHEVKSGCVYLPIWKDKNKLLANLKSLNVEFKPHAVCAVTTAEICDAFRNKIEGIKFVEHSICESFPNSKVFFVDINGNINESAEPAEDFAASNWVASATFLMEEGYNKFILVDMGSTTTDIIPCKNKILSAKKDFDRLKRCELIYVGAVRTPLFYILREFKVPLVPEYFSVIADALIITGDLDPKYYSETPDGRGKSVEECMHRMARQICCDVEELGEEFLKNMAFAARKMLVNTISDCIKWMSVKWNINTVFACGTGDFVIEKAVENLRLNLTMLRDVYGVSETFPAYSCAMLCAKHFY